MKLNSRTGLGGFPRKYSAILTVAATLLLGNAYASDNSIYVDQSGNNSTVTMTQDGAGNVIRGIQGTGTSNTTPAKLYGNSETVTVNQVGTGNILNMGINTTIANGMTGNNYSYSITGNNSTATIDSNNDGQGTSASNNVSITQTGNSSIANVNVLGTNNNITTTTTGGSGNAFYSTVNGTGNTQTVSVSGGGSNTVQINQGVGGTAVNNATINLGTIGASTTNYNGTATVTVQGVSNTVDLQQQGSVAYNNTAVVLLNGSSNIANIYQQANTANTTVNVSSAGNNNTFNITTKAH